MSHENVELAKLGVAAVNETYRSGDLAPWRRHVAATCDPEVVLESKTDAFTDGQWHGHDGVVGFVANQMDVLDEMWLLVDEYIAPGADRLVLAASFGGRARHTGIDMELTRSTS
jgi:hypothetical protein